MAFDPLDHLHQRLVGMTLLVGDTGHANDGRLPDIVQIHFGYRDVEFAAQPAYHGFEYGALSFERIIARQVQFNCAEANDHITRGVPRPRRNLPSSPIPRSNTFPREEPAFPGGAESLPFPFRDGPFLFPPVSLRRTLA